MLFHNLQDDITKQSDKEMSLLNVSIQYVREELTF